MKFNGAWAAGYVQRMIVPDFRAFAAVVTERLLPTFDTFFTEAREHGEKWFRAKAADLDPLNDEQYEAASYLADKAMDETLAYADTVVSMYFGSIGLYSVSLFHLLEQHAADLQWWWVVGGRTSGDTKLRPTPNLGGWKDWLKAEAALDVEALASWRVVNELKLVANTAKHAEGHSAAQLRLIRPELFVHPAKREGGRAPGRIDRSIHKPLFGEGLYVTPNDFSRYAEAVLAFWSEVAHALSQHR
jgi:hypothetical protein